ncbi:type II toxin-antitoxin system RelE/ParE family toxin [Lactobacillus sp. ESL0731]|uniref:type II toxin-antitoxin system RelE/ParE family toxin n=1 Tax=unclassified Lactobacillus TaxID=2620435 RepID=UPI0023F7D942|nr:MULTISPECIES: type II toxin-antitoxin system RelE/ParE family toxin [unclassified Lactobacillus]WEV51171.1 type II toxin-antitoxin system RelE/ParE family toxin [Lactobacillus sp. ESL0700]WEV62301.1 type II toxin-antitoxin system RelE/ParE family toxin [Lactobacillus sp. ESL0731]
MKKIEFEYYNWQEFKVFLDSLPVKEAAKLYATINNIELYGLQIASRQKWIKKLESNLFEIRSQYSSNIQRAIYFHFENNHYVITHAFTKKDQKTPVKEINKAKTRRMSFERGKNNE